MTPIKVGDPVRVLSNHPYRAPEQAEKQNYRIEVNHPVLLAGGGHAPAELGLGPDRPDFVTADDVEVWMERKHQKTRFLDADGGQVGPVHSNLVPAICWARAQGWRDPSLPQWFNDGAIAEVSAGGRQRENEPASSGYRLVHATDPEI